MFSISLPLISIAEDREEDNRSDFEKLFNKIYPNSDKKLHNQNFIAYFYGTAGMSFPSHYFNVDMEPAYLSEFHYGFTRKKINDKMDDVYLHSAEFIYLSNLSSYFHPFDKEYEDITSDAWRFGLGVKNGYGYFLGNEWGITLLHGNAMIWTTVDFEDDGLVEGNPPLKRLDENWKFGSMFNAGVNLYLNNTFSFDILYEHSIVKPDFGFWKGAVNTALSFTIQYIPVFFEEEMIEIFGNYWPVVRFVYQNGMAAVYSTFRREEGQFPFHSKPSLSYDSFKIGAVINFD